jgi:fatty acid-binding protein DegV
MSRFWALTVVTDTGGIEALLAAALAGAAGAMAGLLEDGFSEQAARNTLQAISDRTETVFMVDFLTWRGSNVGPS